MRWADLTYLLAVMRGGSLMRAARSLRVDKTTVSRRLAALEAALGVALIERAPDGRLSLSEAGRKVAARAEAMEDEARRIQADLGRNPGGVAGTVRLTAVPLVIHHLLLPDLPLLSRTAPDLGLELIAEARDLSLTDRDADIALRLARPRDGGQAVLARRIGVLSYGCYAKRGAQAGLPWIGYGAGMQYLAHAQVIEDLALQPGQRRAALSVNDAETLVQAVLSGAGQSLLPCRMADGHAGLERRDVDRALPEREVWLLIRRDIADLARVRAVTGWLEAIFA
jgi:DNA-binding transcriptional LysR family regulator